MVSVGTISSSSIIHDAITKLADFLQNNLTDPRASRTHPNGTWVFPSYNEQRVEWPIVSLEHSGGMDEFLAIGSENKNVGINIELTVQTDSIKQRDEVWDDIYDTLRTHWTTTDTNSDSMRSIGFSDCVVTFVHNVNTKARYGDGNIHWKVAEIHLEYVAT